ncbi:hypothetical protein [Haloprofundus salinisoli]|uniref:hypothetical protein n=1 Tax=Haloprofundus salinisoli TaxID=2876193 RepID=UPI001CCB865B|nr:hypothetical protein [Haloprofundus salinisoli]
MVTGMVVRFITDSHRADEALIRGYLVPSLHRLNAIDGCDGIRFYRLGSDTRRNDGEVRLAIFGDYEAVIDAERNRWDELATEGSIEYWEVDETPSAMGYPHNVGTFYQRLDVLTTEMAALYYQTFDERPEPVDAFPDVELPTPIGWWVAFHLLMNQLGYSPKDEIQACFQCIDNRLFALTALEDSDYAREYIADLHMRLDDIEARIDAREQEKADDYYSGPD